MCLSFVSMAFLVGKTFATNLLMPQAMGMSSRVVAAMAMLRLSITIVTYFSGTLYMCSIYSSSVMVPMKASIPERCILRMAQAKSAISAGSASIKLYFVSPAVSAPFLIGYVV